MAQTATAAGETEESACSDDDYGACSSSPDEGTTKIYWKSEGAINILDESYPDTVRYSREVHQGLREIQRSAPLMEQLELEHRRLQSQPRQTLSEAEELRETVFDITTTLVEELLSLAMIHREEGGQFSPPQPASIETEYDAHKLEDTQAREHFDKAANAYEATLVIYQRVSEIIAPGVPKGLFTLDDMEAISHGHSSVYLLLGDMFHHADFATNEDFEAAYRFFVRSESFCEQSFSIMGIDWEGDDVSSQQQDVDEATRVLKETMATIKSRMGALLADMYAIGYVLGTDSSVEPELMEGYDKGAWTPLGDGQIRLLDLSITKFQESLSLYNQLTSKKDGYMNINGDYRLSVADVCNQMGVVYSHLLKWSESAEELRVALSFYDELFNAYYEAGMYPESVEMATSMLQTTQSLWEGYLNVNGKTDDAKEAFGKHLSSSRYLDRQETFGRPLEDEELEGEEDHHYAYYSGYGTNSDVYGSHDLNFDEALKTYQSMLGEYLKQLRESPIDMAFDYDGSLARDARHEKVYEGSLRASIGSVLLTQNKLWEAKGELQEAVLLLREGSYGDDSFQAINENDEIVDYPVKLELANTLLNLAYVQLGLKQWRSSFDSFDEAMDLYAAELEEGETPMGRSDLGMEEMTKSKNSWSENLSRLLKTSAGLVEEAIGLDDEDKEEFETVINLDNFQSMENASIIGTI